MPEPTLEAAFEEARGLLRSKTITGTSPRDDSLVEVALDPAYDLLRTVFGEPCSCVSRGRVGRVPVKEHDICRGSGVLSRLPHWLAEPIGALEGAMVKALGPLFDSLSTVYLRGLTRLEGILKNLLESDGDTKLPAVQALCEWLKEE